MNEKIIKSVKKNLNCKGLIRLSKFHHGNPPNSTSKVLFLATCDGSPLCMIKIVRDKSANERLKREKEAQEKFVRFGFLSAPRVYFDTVIDGWYLYAEEVVRGRPLSESAAYKKEKEIVKEVFLSPTSHDVPTGEIALIFKDNMDASDNDASFLIKELEKGNVRIKKGFNHGDLTRKNILVSRDKFYLIDWDRAGERPFWLADAVHFMAKLRRMTEKPAEWQKEAASLFVEYTGLDAATANAIYCVETILEIFCKRYPEKYKIVVNELANL